MSMDYIVLEKISKVSFRNKLANDRHNIVLYEEKQKHSQSFQCMALAFLHPYSVLTSLQNQVLHYIVHISTCYIIVTVKLGFKQIL